MKSGRKILLSLSASLVGLVGLCTLAPVLAQDAPPSYVAAPDVYKLISENEQFRVILATWKPGQRDAWHSHAGPLAAYWLTDCKARIHTPDGKYREPPPKAGGVVFNPPVASHSFENLGTTECKSLLVERK
jgi:quercetin dioxygenase-like cupin family protein